MSPLTDDQLDRFARHIVLKEIGGTGQARLLGARVAVIGAGGIGSPVIQYLAAAGIGLLSIADDDVVSLSNLQRQTIYRERDLGHGKPEAALDFVRERYPDTRIVAHRERLSATSRFPARDVLRGHDVIVDGTDSFTTRLLVADTAHDLRIPLVSAAVGQFDGQLGVYRGWEADKPCYRCLVGEDPARADASCADQGVLGALTGVLGSLAAIEAIRQIVRFGEDSAGKLLLVDALAFRFRTITLRKDPGCRCGAG